MKENEREETAKKRVKKINTIIDKCIDKLLAEMEEVPWYIQNGYYRNTFCNLQ